MGSRKGKMNPLKCILEHVWNWIVSPVLKGLSFTKPAKGGRLPHITWCPTGPLMQLPLHAAGIYSARDGVRVYDYAVSSYVPSLSALQRCCDGAQDLCLTPHALIVSQPATPNNAPLPGTEYEGRHLKEVLDTQSLATEWLNDADATVEKARDSIRRSPWVHLACHGSQNRKDLTQTVFEPIDGPLTFSALMSTVSDRAELAFLSACQTAVGDEKVPEESGHLAAGMLAVGSKGVIATDAFYGKLIALRHSGEVGKRSIGAARALHEATKVLREKVGESALMR